MEQRYWEQFAKTGGVYDYLEYKMEIYGHRGDKDQAYGEARIREGSDPAVIPRYRGEDFE